MTSTFQPPFTPQSHEELSSHPNLGHLMLLIFEASMEVVCVSLPGYILARQGMFSSEHQKFVANLNVALFTPCLASKLTAEKFLDLAVIPIVFAVQTTVSYLISVVVAKCFGFAKKPTNFVTAMGVFGNSNSLPISLVISLSQTLNGLHWNKIPGDNDDEVAARGILYLLIFQQLGQLVRWSWGYHVLLAPDKVKSDAEQGNCGDRYTDDPQLISGLDGRQDNRRMIKECRTSSTASFRSDNKTISSRAIYTELSDSENESETLPQIPPTSLASNLVCGNNHINANMTSFPSIRTPSISEEQDIPSGFQGILPLVKLHILRSTRIIKQRTIFSLQSIFASFPRALQNFLLKLYLFISRVLICVWGFMNPPLWAMLSAVVVASVPKMQHLFFTKGTFIANSFTRAVSQSGGVAVPLILVVLGANLARNTLSPESLDQDSEENQIGKKLLIASLISRMVLPSIVMMPLLALAAKYIPISILDDPIFVVVCFLLTGAPSALQLAQICQINGIYENVMSKLLFHSYVIWIFPSTLVLVTCALEVVRWANISK